MNLPILLHKKILLLLLASLWLSGCSVLAPQPYVAPRPVQADQWQNDTGTPASAVSLEHPFWSQFNDPQLSDLIERVIRCNNDILIASQKVRQARITAQMDRTDLWPTPSLSSSTSHSRNLDSAETSHSYGLSAGLNYEMDLWGRLSDQYDSSLLEAEAVADDRDSSLLSLVGTTAELYWQIGYLEQLIELNQQSVAYAQQTLERTRAQLAAGAISQLELIDSEQQRLETQNTLTENSHELRKARHALAILLDEEPQVQIAGCDHLVDAPVPPVQAGIPADILTLRPDVRASERRLRESYLTVETTKKDFYPTISLTGSLGYSSSRLRDLLDNPLATLAGDLALPLVDWQTTQLSVAQAQSSYREAALTFRQTLLTALQEVEDALSARRQTVEQAQSLTDTLRLAESRQALSELRFRCGEVDKQTWQDAQEQRRKAFESVLDNRRAQLNNTLSVYLALGGPYLADWATMENEPQPTSEPNG